jgi:quinol-cytochrome oxidoreductase complex cytochrome b subunit
MLLPWGTNVILGVTVITNLVSIVPIYGDSIVILDLGWSSVGLTYF